jgi:putative thioredoxin
VRSSPYVVAVVEGKPVDSFVGVLPESQLRAFIDRVAPDASELERRKAATLAAAGDRKGAVAALRAALALSPANDDACLDLAGLLLDETTPPLEALRQVSELLARVSVLARQTPRFRALQMRIESLDQAAQLPAVEFLRQKVDADPGDLQARADLARQLIAQGMLEPALEQLLEIVSRDRTFADEFGRKTMLSVFDLMEHQPDTVGAYRRRLASALNR